MSTEPTNSVYEEAGEEAAADHDPVVDAIAAAPAAKDNRNPYRRYEKTFGEPYRKNEESARRMLLLRFLHRDSRNMGFQVVVDDQMVMIADAVRLGRIQQRRSAPTVRAIVTDWIRASPLFQAAAIEARPALYEIASQYRHIPDISYAAEIARSVVDFADQLTRASGSTPKSVMPTAVEPQHNRIK